MANHMHVPQTHETAVQGKPQMAAYHRMAFDLVKSIERTWRTSHWNHIGAVAHPKAEY